MREKNYDNNNSEVGRGGAWSMHRFKGSVTIHD